MAVTSQACSHSPRKSVACPVPLPKVTMCIVPLPCWALRGHEDAARLILAQLALAMQRQTRGLLPDAIACAGALRGGGGWEGGLRARPCMPRSDDDTSHGRKAHRSWLGALAATPPHMWKEQGQTARFLLSSQADRGSS